MRPCLAGLWLSLPVAEFNGAFVSDLSSGRYLAVSSVPPDIARDVYSFLDGAGATPFVSTYDGTADLSITTAPFSATTTCAGTCAIDRAKMSPKLLPRRPARRTP